MDRRVINPWTWQDSFGFVQANEVAGVQRQLLCSGQTSLDADGTPVHPGDMAAQVGQAFDNLEVVLKESGFSLSVVMKLNYYTTDVEAFIESAQVWGQRLGEAGCRPASTLLGVARLAFPELLVEIEATAMA